FHGAELDVLGSRASADRPPVLRRQVQRGGDRTLRFDGDAAEPKFARFPDLLEQRESRSVIELARISDGQESELQRRPPATVTGPAGRQIIAGCAPRDARVRYSCRRAIIG